MVRESKGVILLVRALTSRGRVKAEAEAAGLIPD